MLKHGDRGSEVDARGPAGDGREDDFGRGDGEVFPVVFSDAEEIEPDLIGERALLDDVTQRFGLRQLFSIVIDGDIAKRVETQFNRLRHLGALSLEVRLALEVKADGHRPARGSGG